MLDKYNVMGGVESQLPTIQGVKKTGFVVGNTNLRGGIMLLNGGIFLWDVAQSHEITRPTLAPLEMVVPVPEILVVGTGADMQPLTKEVVEMLRELGIQHEVMPSVFTFFIMFKLIRSRNVRRQRTMYWHRKVEMSQLPFYLQLLFQHVNSTYPMNNSNPTK